MGAAAAAHSGNTAECRRERSWEYKERTCAPQLGPGAWGDVGRYGGVLCAPQLGVHAEDEPIEKHLHGERWGERGRGGERGGDGCSPLRHTRCAPRVYRSSAQSKCKSSTPRLKQRRRIGSSSSSVVTWAERARFLTSPHASPSGVSDGQSIPHYSPSCRGRVMDVSRLAAASTPPPARLRGLQRARAGHLHGDTWGDMGRHGETW